MSRSVLSLLSLVAVLGCSGDPEVTVGDGTTEPATATTPSDADIGEILAEVDGIKIGSKEFELAAARKTPASPEGLTDEQKKEVLDELVTEKMLYLEAKKRGIDLDPKVQKVMVNTLLREDVYSGVRNSDFTDEQLKAYYEEHKDEFVVPEKVQVRRIFIKSGGTRSAEDAKALAEDLYAKVKADPDSFKDVASESSEDPYRRRGGDLGFVSKEGKPGIDDEVITKAFELSEGQISPPFEAGGGFNIVTVTTRRDRVERTFEQMKGSVLRKVKNDKYKELYAAYVGEISPGYSVVRHEEALAGIEVKPARRLSVGTALAGDPEADGFGGEEEEEEEAP